MNCLLNILGYVVYVPIVFVLEAIYKKADEPDPSSTEQDPS